MPGLKEECEVGIGVLIDNIQIIVIVEERTIGIIGDKKFQIHIMTGKKITTVLDLLIDDRIPKIRIRTDTGSRTEINSVEPVAGRLGRHSPYGAFH